MWSACSINRHYTYVILTASLPSVIWLHVPYKHGFSVQFEVACNTKMACLLNMLCWNTKKRIFKIYNIIHVFTHLALIAVAKHEYWTFNENNQCMVVILYHYTNYRLTITSCHGLFKGIFERAEGLRVHLL